MSLCHAQNLSFVSRYRVGRLSHIHRRLNVLWLLPRLDRPESWWCRGICMIRATQPCQICPTDASLDPVGAVSSSSQSTQSTSGDSAVIQRVRAFSDAAWCGDACWMANIPPGVGPGTPTNHQHQQQHRVLLEDHRSTGTLGCSFLALHPTDASADSVWQVSHWLGENTRGSSARWVLVTWSASRQRWICVVKLRPSGRVQLVCADGSPELRCLHTHTALTLDESPATLAAAWDDRHAECYLVTFQRVLVYALVNDQWIKRREIQSSHLIHTYWCQATFDTHRQQLVVVMPGPTQQHLWVFSRFRLRFEWLDLPSCLHHFHPRNELFYWPHAKTVVIYCGAQRRTLEIELVHPYDSHCALLWSRFLSLPPNCSLSTHPWLSVSSLIRSMVDLVPWGAWNDAQNLPVA